MKGGTASTGSQSTMVVFWDKVLLIVDAFASVVSNSFNQGMA